VILGLDATTDYEAGMRFLLLGCALIAACSAPKAPSAWSEDTEAAWTEMQRSLNGTFRATTTENRTITASYRLVSKGSAIVETFTSSSGKETISVYHRDGKTLMATHYCAQGNQPRLRAIEARRERVVFSFADATDVGAEESVMEKLVFVFSEGGFDQESVYKQPDGERETTKLHFVKSGTE
jgi:hypothetical protein